jgi:hypothetical protein
VHGFCRQWTGFEAIDMNLSDSALCDAVVVLYHLHHAPEAKFTANISH